MVGKKFGVLRRILTGLGLSDTKSDTAVDFVVKLLQDDSEQTNELILQEFPYHLRDAFLSPAELEFYKILRRIVRNKAHLITKVNLNDIFYVKSSDYSKFRTYTNKIDRKHIDFLICDWNTLQPIVGVELDDSSHNRKDRQERDKFVDKVFRASNLPIIHIKVQRKYDIKAIARTLYPYINPSEALSLNPESITPEPSMNDAVIICPKCGSDMVLRTAKKGENIGTKFWGCSTYPKCRAIVDLTQEITT